MAGEFKQAGIGNDNKLSSTSDVIDENEDEDKTFDTTNKVDNILSHTRALESKDFYKIIHSSLKLLIKYHTAQDALESFCGSLEPDLSCEIDIKLLHIKLRQGLMPEWDEIMAVITSILAKNVKLKSLADNIISYIITCIYNSMKHRIFPHKIFDTFTVIINGNRKPISYTIHCEAALVAFASVDVSKGRGTKDQDC